MMSSPAHKAGPSPSPPSFPSFPTMMQNMETPGAACSVFKLLRIYVSEYSRAVKWQQRGDGHEWLEGSKHCHLLPDWPSQPLLDDGAPGRLFFPVAFGTFRSHSHVCVLHARARMQALVFMFRALSCVV